jgi:acyl-CoA reductase-like NAD-dependent aldehyde dehydrogenase
MLREEALEGLRQVLARELDDLGIETLTAPQGAESAFRAAQERAEAAQRTLDTARGLKVARQIKSGICHINGATVHDEAQMPFGGVGASGYGRFGSKPAIDAFTELRWITVETEPRQYPI